MQIFHCRYTLKELSFFIVFLESTSKLITFSQRSIILLVGILFEFFTPEKLAEIQRRTPLLPHRIEACHSAEYSLFVLKSDSLIKKMGKFNGAETKVMNGRVPSEFVNNRHTEHSPGVGKITIDNRVSVTKSE